MTLASARARGASQLHFGSMRTRELTRSKFASTLCTQQAFAGGLGFGAGSAIAVSLRVCPEGARSSVAQALLTTLRVHGQNDAINAIF